MKENLPLIRMLKKSFKTEILSDYKCSAFDAINSCEFSLLFSYV